MLKHEEIWRAVMNTVREALAKTELSAKDVAGIGISRIDIIGIDQVCGRGRDRRGGNGRCAVRGRRRCWFERVDLPQVLDEQAQVGSIDVDARVRCNGVAERRGRAIVQVRGRVPDAA